MRNILIIISILCLSYRTTYAQKYPGIMGKYLSLGYCPGFSLALSGQNSGGRYMNIPPLGETRLGESVPIAINITHSFTLDYICNRNTVLNGTFSVMKTSFEIPNYSHFDESSLVQVNPLLAKASGVGFTFGYRKFVAAIPVGWFFTYKVGADFYSSHVSYTLKKENGSLTPDSSMQSINIKSKNYHFIFETGKQLILKDRLLLEISFEADILGCFALVFNHDGDVGEEQSNYVYEDFSRRALKLRIIKRDLTNIHLGISYLLK